MSTGRRLSSNKQTSTLSVSTGSSPAEAWVFSWDGSPYEQREQRRVRCSSTLLRNNGMFQQQKERPTQADCIIKRVARVQDTAKGHPWRRDSPFPRKSR